MRLIAGQFARRRIEAPRGGATRPTPDRVREALFQHLVVAWLDGGFDGRTVFDLYAGSGGLGLEALSRGAARVVFVDAARAAVRCIADNVRALGCGASSEIVAGELPAALGRLGGQASVVFADPPYADRPLAELGRTLLARGLVTPDCLLVFEHDARVSVEAPEGWSTVGARRWGDTAVALFRPVGSEG